MQTATQPQDLRERAIARLRKKRELYGHALAYVLVNAMVVLIWFTVADGGFFWPVFPIAGWGIGLFFHAWDVYKGEPTEDEIRREMHRLG